MIKIISPKELYPTESMFFIEENRINHYMECFKDSVATEDIKVLLFDGNYYIIVGHHKMLAANRLQLSEIPVDIVKIQDNDYWEQNIVANIKALGMTALHDFEAVGDFFYDKYPSCFSEGV